MSQLQFSAAATAELQTASAKHLLILEEASRAFALSKGSDVVSAVDVNVALASLGRNKPASGSGSQVVSEACFSVPGWRSC